MWWAIRLNVVSDTKVRVANREMLDIGRLDILTPIFLPLGTGAYKFLENVVVVAVGPMRLTSPAQIRLSSVKYPNQSLTQIKSGILHMTEP